MKITKTKDKLLRTWVWQADFTCKGRRYKPKAFSKEELERIIIQIKSNANLRSVGLPTNAPKISVSQLVSEHIRDFNYDVEYYRRAKVVVEAFMSFVGGDTAVESITPADLRGFIRYRRTQNPRLQNSSINKDLTFISKMLSSAHEYFRQLASYTAPRMPWEPESTRRNDRVIYEEESRRLLEYLRDPNLHPREKPDSPQIRGDYADMFELAMNSAMRWGEISQLEWPMINIKAGEIVLPKRLTKTDEPRVVPLNSRAREILERRSRSKHAFWVFPRADGMGPRKYYYDRLRSICKKLGLPFGREAGFTLHSTRHTAISSLLGKGVDIATIQQISGHSDREIALRYTHTSKKRVQEAVEKLAEKDTYSDTGS